MAEECACAPLKVGERAEAEAKEGGGIGAAGCQEDVIAVLDAQHQDRLQLAPPHCMIGNHDFQKASVWNYMSWLHSARIASSLLRPFAHKRRHIGLARIVCTAPCRDVPNTNEQQVTRSNAINLQ